ncbi:MAG: hypothetical protein ABR529_06130, partial [Actinomycetota bacterium]
RRLMTTSGILMLLPFLWFQTVIAALMMLGALLRMRLPYSVTGWQPRHLTFLAVGSAALLTRWASLPEKGAGWTGFFLVAVFGLAWIGIGVSERDLLR